MSRLPAAISVLCLAHLAATMQAEGAAVGTEAARVSWEDAVRGAIDAGWLLPQGGPGAIAGVRADQADLVAEMKDLLTGEVGDLIADWQRLREGASGAVPAGLEERARRAGLSASQTLALRALLEDGGVRATTWHPDEDTDDDGFHFAPPFDLRGALTAPWNSLVGSRTLQQGATLIVADLGAIKDAENDYESYPERAGATYEAIHAVKGSGLQGCDRRGRAYSSLQVHFRCDLPFPFSNYSCDLQVVNRVSDDGVLVTDVYSTSPDFYWLAGRDVFLPVKTSQGTWVATVVVRLFGFDLRGVPDGDEQRRAGIRGGLGNLKRCAEKRFAERESERALTTSGRIPTFTVRGWR